MYTCDYLSALRLISGRIHLIEIDGYEAMYESALSNPNSQRYKYLEDLVESEVRKGLGGGMEEGGTSI